MVEAALLRCCNPTCGGRPLDYPTHISNKLLLDIRKHIRKYYSVSTNVGGRGGREMCVVYCRQFCPAQIYYYNLFLLSTECRTMAFPLALLQMDLI